MKTTRTALLALILLGAIAGPAVAATAVSAGIHIGPSGHAAVDLGFFYDDLAPYGHWIQRPVYGWVWTPTAVAASWRPYEYGHWVWTVDGWVWVTDEPFGWATYHYGRWYDDPAIGWAWVPDNTWGPAWVSWQGGGDYVGWAPLPPRVDVGVAYSPGYDTYGYGYDSYAYGIPPDYYTFVPQRNFLSVNLTSFVVPSYRVQPIWRETRNWTNYSFRGDRVYNYGVPVDRIARFSGGRVPRYQIEDLAPQYRFRGDRIRGDRVALFRPQVQRVRVAPPDERQVARRSVVSTARFQQANADRIAFQRRNHRLSRQQAGVVGSVIADRQQRGRSAEARREAFERQPNRGRAAELQRERVDRRREQAVTRSARRSEVQRLRTTQERQVRSQREQQAFRNQNRELRNRGPRSREADARNARVERQRPQNARRQADLGRQRSQRLERQQVAGRQRSQEVRRQRGQEVRHQRAFRGQQGAQEIRRQRNQEVRQQRAFREQREVRQQRPQQVRRQRSQEVRQQREFRQQRPQQFRRQQREARPQFQQQQAPQRRRAQMAEQRQQQRRADRAAQNGNGNRPRRPHRGGQ